MFMCAISFNHTTLKLFCQLPPLDCYLLEGQGSDSSSLPPELHLAKGRISLHVGWLKCIRNLYLWSVMLGQWFLSYELHTLSISELLNKLMSVLASSEYKPVKYVNICCEHKSTLKNTVLKVTLGLIIGIFNSILATVNIKWTFLLWENFVLGKWHETVSIIVLWFRSGMQCDKSVCYQILLKYWNLQKSYVWNVFRKASKLCLW